MPKIVERYDCGIVNSDDWAEALTRLANDKALRIKNG